MSKIICDVCGTSYPETSTQCPICGCVRPVEAKGVSGDTSAEKPAAPVKRTKGGHFSKANVQKRNKNTQTPVRNTTTAKVAKDNKKEDKTTAGLIITAVVLILAIIAVAIYISLRFFAPEILDDPQQILPPQQTQTNPTDAEPETDAPEIPCEEVSVDVAQITFDSIGVARMINITVLPADTTDTVTWESSNEDVVTVNADGKVTAVGPGEATITVTCGSAVATCDVICTYVPPVETTQATTEATEAKNEFMLNRSDITFSKKGESWLVYSGNIGKTEITWSSDDTAVATVENGKIVAVGGGTTKIYGEYKGEKVSCIIRCNFSDSSDNQGVSGNGGGVSEDDGSGSDSASASSGYQLYNPYGSAEDVSIKVGESFSLQLMDPTGNYVSPTWAVTDSGCCEASGNTFTGKSAGTTSVTATYDGVTYTCVVRVSG